MNQVIFHISFDALQLPFGVLAGLNGNSDMSNEIWKMVGVIRVIGG
jgi:hypothetical protein